VFPDVLVPLFVVENHHQTVKIVKKMERLEMMDPEFAT